MNQKIIKNNAFFCIILFVSFFDLLAHDWLPYMDASHAMLRFWMIVYITGRARKNLYFFQWN